MALASLPAQPKLDLPTIAVALVDLGKDAALAAWGEAKAIFEVCAAGVECGQRTRPRWHTPQTCARGVVVAPAQELKGGKTTKLEALVAGTLSTFRGAASSAVAFVRKEADEHLPEGVKKQLAQGAAQAQALWKEHVTDAAWVSQPRGVCTGGMAALPTAAEAHAAPAGLALPPQGRPRARGGGPPPPHTHRPSRCWPRSRW